MLATHPARMNSVEPRGLPRTSAAGPLRRRLPAAGVAPVCITLALVCIALALAVVAVLGRAGGGPLTSAGAPGAVAPAAARVWVVRPGDTLWSIARAIEPRADVRPLVDRLDAEVGDSALYPGERVAIP